MTRGAPLVLLAALAAARVPLIHVMDHPPLDQVKVGIMDDQQINAANAGKMP